LGDTDELKRINYKLAVLDNELQALDSNLKSVVNILVSVDQLTLASVQYNQAIYAIAAQIKDLFIRYSLNQFYATHRNPLNKCGQKSFSQTDEDGITLEIVRRLGLGKGCFAEFGVGNGLENNTIILGTLGWKGFWVGGEDLLFDISKCGRLHYIKDWITLDNLSQHAKTGLGLLGADSLDIISLDLDGNDIYFTENLLETGFVPKLFIVEYNGKFPPPARFQISYDPAHKWTGDDYYGAALMNFIDLFEKHQFRLVCCNSFCGLNAFFVRNEFSHLFEDVPKDIRDLYVGICYHTYSTFGHRLSAKTLETIFM